MPVSEYAEAIIKPMLTQPECFQVSQTQDAMGVLLTIDVHKADMGLLVGKQGETAKCVRHLVRIVGMANKQRVSIRINEPEGSDYKRNTNQNE